MLGKRLNGSSIGFHSLLSPLAVSTPGSTNAVDLSKYSQGIVQVHGVSADMVVNIERSATSGGTFGQIGCSVAGTASGISVRAFPLDSSAIWYKASYDNGNAGSMITAITLLALEPREVPINQPTRTTSYSDVL